VHGELLAQAAPASRYRAIGPDTRIGREAAMPLALAFHELTLNALLHGVLAEPAGEIEVRWDHEDGDGLKRLRLVWAEHGTPDSRHSPTLKGFGLELIEKTLPYELDACTRVDWPGPGARVEILLPAQGRAMFWRPGDKAHVA
jgi:two-component system, chemotaxis family, CheB/CheR fusion protein